MNADHDWQALVHDEIDHLFQIPLLGRVQVTAVQQRLGIDQHLDGVEPHRFYQLDILPRESHDRFRWDTAELPIDGDSTFEVECQFGRRGRAIFARTPVIGTHDYSQKEWQ